MKKLMLAALVLGLSANAVIAEEVATEAPVEQKKDIAIFIEGGDVVITPTADGTGITLQVTDSYVTTSGDVTTDSSDDVIVDSSN